ncbi:MAG: ribonuclease J [Acidimicrobiales bacterium]
MSPAKELRITFLGGLGEIGRNCACIEVEGKLIVVDCGVMFPDPDMPGVDLVLPDLSYIVENADRLEGIVLTHGHEDHTGALSFLLRKVSAPIYGSRLTLGLASNRIREAGLLDETSLIEVRDGDRVTIGGCQVEFIPVTHSVPDAFALAFHTPQGVVLHSGDFKLDLDPVDGRRTDLSRIGELARGPGIRLLLADSTNAEESGYTASESTVGGVLRRIMVERPTKRVVVACFASHIHRIQQIMDAAQRNGRHIAILGRSLAHNVELARSLGVLTVDDRWLLDVDQINDFEPGDVCVISTGSQGEPMSALSLMANGENKRLTIGGKDVVVISAHPIPGNEWHVGRVIDGLHRRGAEVIHHGKEPVHVSGHARREELRTLLSVAQPGCFIPVHGEYRHLVHHAELAKSLVPPDQVLLCEDGDVVTLDSVGIRKVGEVPADLLYVDGTVGGVGHGVLRDRRLLADEGMVVVVANVSVHDLSVVGPPRVITRGWVHGPQADELLEDAASAVEEALQKAMSDGARDTEALARSARKALGKLVSERTHRRPLIIPVVLSV